MLESVKPPKPVGTVDEYINALFEWYEQMIFANVDTREKIESKLVDLVRAYSKKCRSEDKRYILWVGVFERAYNDSLKSALLSGWPRKGLYDLSFLNKIALDVKISAESAAAPRRLAFKLLVVKYRMASELPEFVLDQMYIEATLYGRSFLYDTALKTLSDLTGGAIPRTVPAGKDLVAYVHELDTNFYVGRYHKRPATGFTQVASKEEFKKALNELEGTGRKKLIDLLLDKGTSAPRRQAAGKHLAGDRSGISMLLKSFRKKDISIESFLHVTRALAEAAFSNRAREKIVNIVFRRFRKSKSRAEKLAILDQFWWLTRGEGQRLLETAVRDTDPLVRLKAYYVAAKVQDDPMTVLADLRKIKIKNLNMQERILIEGVLSRLYKIIQDRLGPAIGTEQVWRWYSYNKQDEYERVLDCYENYLDD